MTNLILTAVRWASLACCCVASFTEGEIRQVEDISVLEQVVTPETLVLTDIDTTLLRSSVSLGWTEWWRHVSERMTKCGVDKTAVRPILNPMAGWIMQHIPMEPMEAHTAAVINGIQSRGISIMALTARSKKASFCPQYDRVTRDQVRSIGIDFTKGEVVLDEQNFVSWGYTDGIIFTNGHHKGPSLVAFLRHYGHTPQRIVLIDDKLDMLESVEEAMEREGIPFLGLHYVRSDRPFNIAAANIQWYCLTVVGSVPSDEEAIAIYEASERKDPNFFLDFMIDQTRKVVTSGAE